MQLEHHGNSTEGQQRASDGHLWSGGTNRRDRGRGLAASGSTRTRRRTRCLNSGASGRRSIATSRLRRDRAVATCGRAVATSRLRVSGLANCAVRNFGDRRVHGGITLDEVGTSQTCSVCVVENKRGITEEGRVTGNKRRVGVGELGREGIRGDLAIFAAEVTDLASLGAGSITGGLITTLGRIEMAKSSSAVATSCGLDVEVVDCGGQLV